MKNTLEPSTILEISGDNTFEVFNDQQIDKVRFVYVDAQDESHNIRLLLNYKNFNAFSSMIRKMTLNEFEELKDMFNAIQD